MVCQSILKGNNLSRNDLRITKSGHPLQRGMEKCSVLSEIPACTGMTYIFHYHAHESGHLVFCCDRLCRRFLLKAGMTC